MISANPYSLTEDCFNNLFARGRPGVAYVRGPEELTAISSYLGDSEPVTRLFGIPVHTHMFMPSGQIWFFKLSEKGGSFSDKLVTIGMEIHSNKEATDGI